MDERIEELEDWAERAGQALQDVCDEAQEVAGNPHGEDQCPDLRVLIKELDAILLGQPTWQVELFGQQTEELDL